MRLQGRPVAVGLDRGAMRAGEVDSIEEEASASRGEDGYSRHSRTRRYSRR